MNTVNATVRREMLGALVRRVQIDLWNQPSGRSAEAAGWLALASLYYPGWDATK